jgi:hypothetical protein
MGNAPVFAQKAHFMGGIIMGFAVAGFCAAGSGAAGVCIACFILCCSSAWMFPIDGG